MNTEKSDYMFRIVMAGDSGVGKTNLLERYTTNEFNFETKTTIGAQFSQKLMKVDGKTIEAQIWDTAGQERFQAVTSAYFRGALGALLVYDVCESNSFHNTVKWINLLRQLAAPDVVIILVGNKSDLTNLRNVQCDEAQAFAAKNAVEFIETSALTGENVNLAFDSLAKKIYFLMREREKHNVDDSPQYVDRSSHKLTIPNRKKRKSCC